MDKHIKLFENHDEYVDFIGGGEYVEPHVSLCKTEGCVQYNKKAVKP